MGDNEDNEPPLPKRVKRRQLVEFDSTEDIPRNYGRAPLIRDFFTDSPSRPLSSSANISSANINNDPLGGGMSLSAIRREKTSFSYLQLNSTSMEDAASESNSFLKEFYSGSMEDAAASESNSFLKEFYIPDYILVLDGEQETLPNLPLPECPVIVFINSKLCGNLLLTYRSLLNENQVIDLLEEAPDKFLSKLYLNLEKLKHRDDELALRIQEKLRIIVAGGDGTAVWILRVLCDLNLSHPPPIATVPLGTGNNLPFAFGWEKNPGTDRQSAKSFLHQVMKAKEMKIDNWHLLMRMTTPKEANCNPIAPLELPHSFHSFERVSASDSSNIEGYLTFRGGFWNYFSMGMDAQVSYAFHSEKNLHPDKFKNQLVNQGTYARLGCTKGWFLDSLLHPADKNIQQLASVKVMKKQATEWEELHIPHSIRSIVCLNLPSFSGGLNPWGTPNKNETRNSGFTPPCVDDGLIEVVGFTDVWHGLVLLAPNGHGTRLAQANRVRFEFRKGATDHTFMRIDGEPWKQPLPVDDDTVVVEISHHGQVHMLATDGCRSRSIQDPTSLDYSGSLEDDKEDESVAEGEKWRIPDEVDISRLS